MTIGVFSTIKVKPGRNTDFETRFAEQAANCKANEPGQLLYKLFKSRTEPQTYHIMAMYVDEAALEKHRKSKHLAQTIENVRETMDGRSTGNWVDAVGD